MKTNKLMIASLLMLIGMGVIVASCKKEQTPSSQKLRKAEITTEESKEKNDPDEEPYIRVRVKKKISFSPVDNANVETFTYGTNVRISSDFTDASGETRQNLPVGTYYFHVTVPGTSTPYVTDTIYVNKDIIANVLID